MTATEWVAVIVFLTVTTTALTAGTALFYLIDQVLERVFPHDAEDEASSTERAGNA